MGQSERPLTALGRHVAEQQDGAPAARLDRDRGRARFLAAEPPARALPAKRVAIRFAAMIAAVGMLIAIALFIAVRPHDPMRFELGATEPGRVGEWIAAPPAGDLPIRFSDGSRLVLAPGGRARVASVNADGAEIALERGALDLSVVHAEHTRWTVRVGPFQIHVIGTRFETSWDPVTEQFEVALREGAITVSGPVVGDSRAVHAGERLTISPAKNTLAIGSIDTTAAIAPTPMLMESAAAPNAEVPSAAPIAPIAPMTSAAPKGQSSAEPSIASAQAPSQETPDWRALAVEAKYKDALAAAEIEGFDAICGAASATDLRALGDAARLGGSSARATQAFAALRKRFPGSAEAASAAFMLGRIAQDQSKDYAGAAAWFTRYLSEQPGGAFAAEAAGRLVEAEDKMGDDAGARTAAKRYLAAHPSGSHAGYAKSVLARGSSEAP